MTQWSRGIESSGGKREWHSVHKEQASEGRAHAPLRNKRDTGVCPGTSRCFSLIALFFAVK